MNALFFVSLLFATAFVVVGYFVLYASSRTDGRLRNFGKYLAIWHFVLATLVVLGGLLAPSLGIRGPMAGMEQHMQKMEQLQQEQSQMLREQRDKQP